MSKKFIQYQLWQRCNNACSFCGEMNQPQLDQQECLQRVIQKLDNPEVINYQEIGIIGGEIFDTQLDNPEVSDLFYQLMDKITSMHFEKIYIATSLIFDMDRHLTPLLNYLQEGNILDKVLICTSFDLKYRFHTKDKLQLWESNMDRLSTDYPQLQTHIETIMTQFFIDAVLSGEFNILDFQNRFNTRVDYIEPSSGLYYNNKQHMQDNLKDFFPTKSSFIKLLVEYGIRKQHIDLSCLLSMELRSNTIYVYDNYEYHCNVNRREDTYIDISRTEGKQLEKGFIDSTIKMREIVQNIMELSI